MALKHHVGKLRQKQEGQGWEADTDIPGGAVEFCVEIVGSAFCKNFRAQRGHNLKENHPHTTSSNNIPRLVSQGLQKANVQFRRESIMKYFRLLQSVTGQVATRAI